MLCLPIIIIIIMQGRFKIEYLLWNTVQLYYSTVELGYRHSVHFLELVGTSTRHKALFARHKNSKQFQKFKKNTPGGPLWSMWSSNILLPLISLDWHIKNIRVRLHGIKRKLNNNLEKKTNDNNINHCENGEKTQMSGWDAGSIFIVKLRRLELHGRLGLLFVWDKSFSVWTNAITVIAIQHKLTAEHIEPTTCFSRFVLQLDALGCEIPSF